jgi:hypothetical protein
LTQPLTAQAVWLAQATMLSGGRRQKRTLSGGATEAAVVRLRRRAGSREHRFPNRLWIRFAKLRTPHAQTVTGYIIFGIAAVLAWRRASVGGRGAIFDSAATAAAGATRKRWAKRHRLNRMASLMEKIRKWLGRGKKG